MRRVTRIAFFVVALSSFGAAAASGCGGGDETVFPLPGSGSSSTSGSSGAGGAGHGGGSASSTSSTSSSTSTSSASSSTSTSSTSSSTSTSSTSSSASSSTSTSSSGAPAVKVACQGKYYECGDLLDNDNDGLIDAEDPDCLGACDNTEGSYYGGIPGQAGPACTVDCYFDQDSGSGNDDCHWNHKCDPNEVSPGYYPEADHGAQCSYDLTANTPGTNQTCDQLYNTQSAMCLAFCGPLTPNGCDCFGCCELPSGSNKFVWLGSSTGGVGTCDLASVGDPTKCEPCLPVKACMNTCATCELCVGKSQLPASCFPDGGSNMQQCPAGIQACGLPGEAPCPGTDYCITGCCQAHL